MLPEILLIIVTFCKFSYSVSVATNKECVRDIITCTEKKMDSFIIKDRSTESKALTECLKEDR